MSEKAEIGNWGVGSDFRFFTPLRSVQNDRGRGVAFSMTKDEGVAFGMTEDEGVAFGMTKDEGAAFRMAEEAYVTSVISSEVRKLKLGTGGCATTLDSSLRCAGFRMTGKGRCVRDDKG